MKSSKNPAVGIMHIIAESDIARGYHPKRVDSIIDVRRAPAVGISHKATAASVAEDVTIRAD